MSMLVYICSGTVAVHRDHAVRDRSSPNLPCCIHRATEASYHFPLLVQLLNSSAPPREAVAIRPPAGAWQFCRSVRTSVWVIVFSAIVIEIFRYMFALVAELPVHPLQ